MEITQNFLGRPGLMVAATIGASRVTVLSLIQTALTAAGIRADTILSCIVMAKKSDGNDRIGVLASATATDDQGFYGTGQDVDPPWTGSGWYVQRAAGDVACTIMVNRA